MVLRVIKLAHCNIRPRKYRILRYVSDLHLEFRKNIDECPKFYNYPQSPNTENYLALLGDISIGDHRNLMDLFHQISPQYHKIFYIPGNHEYYTPNRIPYTKIYDSLNNICSSFPNIHLLNNTTYQLDDTVLLGTTLWSNISTSYQTADLYHIYKTSSGQITNISNEDRNQWNKEAISFLRDNINRYREKKIIVLTHHAPLYNNKKLNQYTSDPRHAVKNNGEAFHNNLSQLVCPPVNVWLYGHTHHCGRFTTHQGTVVATNQLGYHRENLQFDPWAGIYLD